MLLLKEDEAVLPQDHVPEDAEDLGDALDLLAQVPVGTPTARLPAGDRAPRDVEQAGQTLLRDGALGIPRESLAQASKLLGQGRRTGPRIALHLHVHLLDSSASTISL